LLFIPFFLAGATHPLERARLLDLLSSFNVVKLPLNDNGEKSGNPSLYDDCPIEFALIDATLKEYGSGAIYFVLTMELEFLSGSCVWEYCLRLFDVIESKECG
jgi:hypothetical protein